MTAFVGLKRHPKSLHCVHGKQQGIMSRAQKLSPHDPETGLIVKSKPKTKKPSMYRVVLLNDDYTPMDFVVYVLESIFGKNREEATQIMLHVHRKGIGLCGIYPYDVAETKSSQVIALARRNQHPLQCVLEKE